MTTNTIDDQLATARADFQRPQAFQDRINTAGNEARSTAKRQHYRAAATERSADYRQHRDELKNKLDEIAMSDQLDIDAQFAAWVALRDPDAKAGAINVHSSMLDSLEGPRKNHIGAYEMPRGAAVNELYTPANGWTFTAFVDRVLALRADRIRAEHQAELQAEAAAEIAAGVDKARAAAAAQIDNDN
jgi:hypothetical protein